MTGTAFEQRRRHPDRLQDVGEVMPDAGGELPKQLQPLTFLGGLLDRDAPGLFRHQTMDLLDRRQHREQQRGGCQDADTDEIQQMLAPWCDHRRHGDAVADHQRIGADFRIDIDALDAIGRGGRARHIALRIGRGVADERIGFLHRSLPAVANRGQVRQHLTIRAQQADGDVVSTADHLRPEIGEIC
jgi:hypothetical protein